MKISVAEVMVQQRRSNGETAFGACLQMAVKKIYRDLGQQKKTMHAKVQIKDIGPGRFVQAPKMGEIFIGTAWAHVLPGRTKNVPKMHPKHTRHRHQCSMQTCETIISDTYVLSAAMCSPDAFSFCDPFVHLFLKLDFR